MKVKKYVAPSMPEAMKMIRAELGSEAVILNSKVVYINGFLGLFKKKNIEVIAAIDSKPAEQKMLKKEKVISETTSHKIINQRHDQNQNSEKKINTSSDSGLLDEIKQLKVLMQELSSDVNSNFEHYPGPLKEINELLIKQEINDILRRNVLSQLLEKWYLNGGNIPKSTVMKWLQDNLVQEISSYQFGGISFQKKYINVVGPTGVGKTTTLAKIAAECILKKGKKVAFITTDTYRIAAIDQLKTYAKILGVPIEVTYNLEDFKQAKEKFSDFDLVLIDTAGRNFRNKRYVEDLKEIIDFNSELETLLVLSLTSKYTDMISIYEQFSTINIDKFIFTKKDETSNYGAIINLVTKYGKGVAYLTNGQNVPDDIQPASANKIVETIIGEEQP
ncbi:flagellar biosynthesis protein FlhF [Bacillus timonensis]|nr:flagellar biosynthesis protein FlhF [Bacillus timonensis]